MYINESGRSKSILYLIIIDNGWGPTNYCIVYLALICIQALQCLDLTLKVYSNLCCSLNLSYLAKGMYNFKTNLN